MLGLLKRHKYRAGEIELRCIVKKSDASNDFHMCFVQASACLAH
jgi:hypothetical protein